MNVKGYMVNAFSQSAFRGNPCVVCILPEWPDDQLLQNMALQHQVAETAYIVPRNNKNPELRWFTVSQEVDFCGYGTLSAAQVYLTQIDPHKDNVTFSTRRYGDIPVSRVDGRYEMIVPAKQPLNEKFDDAVALALGNPKPEKMITSERGDLLLVYPTESDVCAVQPNIPALMATGYFGYVLTAPGVQSDYAYRYFSPRMTNVWEDPVNGASQSVLAPYWSNRLGKSDLHGCAVSKRGGDVYCRNNSDKTVTIGGYVTPYAGMDISLV